MPNIKSSLEERLYDMTMGHLAKLEQYVPGRVKKAGGSRKDLLKRYADDPIFSIFGLDSPEYMAATLAGGTVTSIHRKIGDTCEDCVTQIFMTTLNQTADQVTYSAVIRNGDIEEQRSADTYLQFDRLEPTARKRIRAYCQKELRALSSKPRVTLIGVGMEVRHCYQTGDSKRAQADEAMARHLLVSGIMPLMPLFCNQGNPSILRRYRSVWVVRQGFETYDMIKTFSGFDYYDFMQRNREDFRKPVIEVLRSLMK